MFAGACIEQFRDIIQFEVKTEFAVENICDEVSLFSIQIYCSPTALRSSDRMKSRPPSPFIDEIRFLKVSLFICAMKVFVEPHGLQKR